MFLPAGRLLLFALLFHPGVAKVCNDRTKHEQDNSWFLKKEEALNIMVLMPMNESALMSSISQGIEPAVQLAIEHINDSGEYPFSLITKIYDTEVSGRVCECTCRPMRARACVCVCVSAHPRSALLCVCVQTADTLLLVVIGVRAFLVVVPVFPLHQRDRQYSIGL